MNDSVYVKTHCPRRLNQTIVYNYVMMLLTTGHLMLQAMQQH